MTFSQLLVVASVHHVWHLSLCGCSSMWSPPAYSSSYHTRLPWPTVQFVLAPFPRWQNRRDAAGASHSFSHVWMSGLLVCLFACSLFSVKGIYRRNPEIQCPCLWFVTEQGSMVHIKSLPPFGIISLRDSGDSPCQMVSVFDIGSEIWTLHTLQQQTHGLRLFSSQLLCPSTVTEICWTETQLHDIQILCFLGSLVCS